MIAFFGLVGMFLLVLTLLLGIGIGVGLLLEWLLAIERGFAVLIGVVATTVAVHLLMRFLSAVGTSEEDELPEVMFVPPQSWRPRKRTPKR
jgi:hypothetical protein